MSPLDAWRPLLSRVADAHAAAYATRAEALRLQQWFERLVPSAWHKAPPTWRSRTASEENRLLGLRAWRPLEVADGDNEVSGRNLQLQVLVGPRYWKIQQDESESLRANGAHEIAERMFLLQGDPAGAPDPSVRDDAVVHVFLAWRLPYTSMRAPSRVLVESEMAIARCLPDLPALRVNGDAQRPFTSTLMLGCAAIDLPTEPHDEAAFLDRLEQVIHTLFARADEVLSQDGPRAVILEQSARAFRADLPQRSVTEPTEPVAEEEAMGAVAASLLELLRAGSEKDGWPKNVILYGPPGTGKTHVARQVYRQLLRDEQLHVDEDRSCFVVFHPAFEYDQFVGGLRVEAGADGHPRYHTEPGVFTRFAERASEQRDLVHVLIIDEINRGNVPKLLGELLFALEYRGTPVTVSFRKEPLTVPPNLLVIGTMNTADRSISSLDAAVRRRFAFLEVPPDPEQIVDPLRRAVLERINDNLRDLPELDGLAVGHTYLLDEASGAGPIERAAQKWRYQVVPLLEEYARYAGRPVEQLLPRVYVQGKPNAWKDLKELVAIEARLDQERDADATDA